MAAFFIRRATRCEEPTAGVSGGHGGDDRSRASTGAGETSAASTAPASTAAPPSATTGRTDSPRKIAANAIPVTASKRHADPRARRPDPVEHDEEQRERRRGRDPLATSAASAPPDGVVQLAAGRAERRRRRSTAPIAVHAAAVSESVRGRTRSLRSDVGREHHHRPAHEAARRSSRSRPRRRRSPRSRCPRSTSASASSVRARSRIAPVRVSTSATTAGIRVEDQRDRGRGAAFEAHVEERRLDRVDARARARSAASRSPGGGSNGRRDARQHTQQDAAGDTEPDAQARRPAASCSRATVRLNRIVQPKANAPASASARSRRSPPRLRSRVFRSAPVTNRGSRR